MSDTAEFFKYANPYARYQRGMLDAGDPGAGAYLTRDERNQLEINRDTLLLAKQIGPGLSYDEFKQLRDQVEEINLKHRSARKKQDDLWGLPEKFSRTRGNASHYSPSRDESGKPSEGEGYSVEVPSAPSVSTAAEGLASEPPAGPTEKPDFSGLLGKREDGSEAPSELQSEVKQEDGSTLGQSAPEASTVGNAIDSLQTGLDAAGVIDPTPVVDGVNAAISIGRAFMDPGNAGKHLANAGVSLVSMVPYVGDLAKLLKYGGKGVAAAAKGTGAASAAAGHAATGGHGKAGWLQSLLGLGAGMAGSATGGGGSGGGSGGGGIPPGDSGAGGGGWSGGSSGGWGGAGHWSNTVSSVLGSIASFAWQFGGAGLAIGGAAVALKGFVSWLSAVDEKSRRLIEENRELAKWDGRLANAYARLDMERLQRTIERAESMSGPLGRLTGAQSRYEQAQEDLVGPFKKIAADFQAANTTLATWAVRAIDSMTNIDDGINALYALFDKDNGKKEARDAAEALERASRERRELERKRRLNQ
jgi:hypothetical protein